MTHTLDPQAVSAYVRGGKSTFTLQSGNTLRHFTYRMERYKDTETFFVEGLYGADNTDDYSYIGCYYADTKTFRLRDAWLRREEYARPPQVRAIDYFLTRLDRLPLPHNLFVYGSGRCARCGRLLTTPESIRLGFGPECKDRR